MLDAIHHASDEGIFVITTSTEMNYDFFEAYGTDAPFAGLGKLDPLGDPDSPDTYTLGSWQWESAEMFEKSLLVPMDGRTTADMSGDTYVYYADGRLELDRALHSRCVCALRRGRPRYYARKHFTMRL